MGVGVWIAMQTKQQNIKNQIHTYGNVVYVKGASLITEGKDSLFNKHCWENMRSVWKTKTWILPHTI